LELSAFHRHSPGVVAGRALLFVAGMGLVVHDQKAQFRSRNEDCGAPSAPKAMSLGETQPVARSFGIRPRAVEAQERRIALLEPVQDQRAVPYLGDER
jgi:hypothetical protein